MIIVISSNSGGVAKSTTAMHLASYMSSRRGVGKVALVDADQNESCLDWNQRGPGHKFDVISSDDDLEGYDHLILDTAAAPDSDELAEVLESSDLLLIPTTPSPLDLSPAIATANSFDLDEGDVLMLLTLCPPAPSRVGAIALEAVQEAGIPVVPHTITRRNCYLEAAVMGVTVNDVKGASAKKAWKEWQAAGKEMLKGRL